MKPENRRANEDFENLVNERIDTAVGQMGLFQDVVRGRLSRPQLRTAARRYYAEVRTFVDLKLPERLRLCPSDALRARRFLAEIYTEEHGNFEPGRDHPALWARFCHALGIGERALEDEYRSYSARFRYLREREPSRENLVTELATMAAWESVVPRLARLPIQSLREAYGIAEDALEFFRVHQQADAAHSRAALDVLSVYADSPELRKHSLGVIEETLDLEGYFA